MIHAWAAGFIDGEGCIYLKPFKSKNAHAGYRYQPKIVVGNTEKAPLDKLAELYGGSVRLRRKPTEHHKPCWAWELSGGRAVTACIKEILPYLITGKKDEAALLLTVAEQMQPGGRKMTPLTLEELDHRATICEQLRQMKRRTMPPQATSTTPTF